MADCAALGGFRETARTGSPVHALRSAWRGPVTRRFSSVRPGGRRAVGQATRPTASHGGKEMQQGGGLHPAEGTESPERTQVHSE